MQQPLLVIGNKNYSFWSLRAQLPMNCRASGRRVSIDSRLAADIARVVAIWLECRGLDGRGARENSGSGG